MVLRYERRTNQNIWDLRLFENVHTCASPSSFLTCVSTHSNMTLQVYARYNSNAPGSTLAQPECLRQATVYENCQLLDLEPLRDATGLMTLADCHEKVRLEGENQGMQPTMQYYLSPSREDMMMDILYRVLSCVLVDHAILFSSIRFGAGWRHRHCHWTRMESEQQSISHRPELELFSRKKRILECRRSLGFSLLPLSPRVVPSPKSQLWKSANRDASQPCCHAVESLKTMG